MAEGGNIEILEDSLAKARIYFEQKNFGRSFAHYLVVFQLMPPQVRNHFEKEFTNVLHFWGSILHRRGKYEDVFRCYHLAISYFPTSVEILNNLGVHALKLKCLNAAKNYFTNCLIYNPNFLPAEQNLQSTKYALVERWHFPMLNDLVRNKSYAQAIFMEISHGHNTILDVGTGTGILSLFASKSKQCKSIIACDYSETMFEIATKVLAANNVQNVHLVKKKSNNLMIPTDLKAKTRLLVTEILDCGIFGENILETLVHAWENLLDPYPYGKVIPAGVSIFVSAMQSEEIARKVRVLPRENNILQVNSMCLTHSTAPYDAENLLHFTPTYMTQPQRALYVNFNSLSQLKRITLSEEDDTSIFSLKCIKGGHIDAFTIWFQLYLNDSVTLTNDPTSDSSTCCWDQAVYHLRHPLKVAENEELTVKLSCFEGFVEVECAQVVNNDISNDDGACFLVPRSTVMFLNDTLLMNYLEDVASLILERFSNTAQSGEPSGSKDHPSGPNQLTVLDMSPFPVLGLLLAKCGAKVTSRVKNPGVEIAVRHMCRLNQINEKHVTYVTAAEFNDYTSESMEFDVVLQNFVTPSGLLNESEIYQAQVMKLCLTQRGIYLPNKVYVWVQVVQCDWLDQATKVDDKNVCGFKIAQFINEYKSTEQRDIKFDKIPHECLTEPTILGELIYNISTPHLIKTNVPVTKTGCANAIYYWFEIELMEGMNINTKRPESFANNSCFMLDSSFPLDAGETVCLALKQHKGIMKIFSSQPD